MQKLYSCLTFHLYSLFNIHTVHIYKCRVSANLISSSRPVFYYVAKTIKAVYTCTIVFEEGRKIFFFQKKSC